ncbi:hypothetical protein G5I_04343 [Acromyrmex echinatior]|uniref:Uncharacterized protein n=1 Tax=Acromyrmex echinatior TaxID=103372 RepID=F4WFD6_ACREC|nr:hypothetical protein G5I_04343 [Acromyrmex echinatior]
MHFFQGTYVPNPRSVVTRFATQRITSRGVLRCRCRLLSYTVVRFPAAPVSSKTQIIAVRDCTVDLRATDEFPKKRFVEKKPLTSLLAAMHHAMQHERWKGGIPSSSVSEHYRSKLAKRAAPAEQKQSIAAASCETITLRRKLPFEVPRNSPKTGISQEVKCRYRVERAPQFRGMVHFAVH